MILITIPYIYYTVTMDLPLEVTTFPVPISPCVWDSFATRCIPMNSKIRALPSYAVGLAAACQFALLWKLRQMKDNMSLKSELQILIIGVVICFSLGAIFLRWTDLRMAVIPHFDIILLFSVGLVAINFWGSLFIPVRKSFLFFQDPHVADVHDLYLTFQVEPSMSRSNRRHTESFISLMSNPDMFERFKHFLCAEFSVENLLFYADVGAFKSDPSFQSVKRIFETYIRPGSPMEINIIYSSRNEVEDQMLRLKDVLNEPESEVEHHPEVLTIFDKSAKQILKLLVTDPFLRFVNQNQDLMADVSLTGTREFQISTSKPLREDSKVSLIARRTELTSFESGSLSQVR
jgi:hypothetical protein